MTENNKNWLGQAEIPKTEAKNQIPKVISAENLLPHEEKPQIPQKSYNPERMGRMKYFIHTFLIPIGVIIAFVIIFIIFGSIFWEDSNVFMFLGFLALLAFIIITIHGIIATIKRCHDLNMSGWFTLLFYLFWATFVLWFIPGTDGDNDYWPQNP